MSTCCRARTRVVGLAIAIAALAGAAGAAGASGQGAALGTDLLPWPQSLPPKDIPNEVQAKPVEHCRVASVSCVERLEGRLERQWTRLDASCDHRAVIAYSYLEITRGLLADLDGPHEGSLVANRRWMALLITNFSNRYFRAFDRWAAGRPLTEAWRVTFEAAEQGDLNAGQEVLLFSNVHVQHDLPFAYERMGLETRAGASRKPDHDAVNEVNARVFDGIEKFIAGHYDPSFSLIDLPVVPLDEIGTLELVKLWRENAWRSAERLLAADSPAERATVVETITETSVAWARLISSVRIPGYGAARDEFCAAH